MPEEPRRSSSDGPQNPPASVTNPRVRRLAVWTYLGPIAALFVVVGIAMLFWPTGTRSPTSDAGDYVPRAEGTSGRTTPGGGDPQRTPDSAREELEHRAGDTLRQLGAVLEEGGRGTIGRRVDIRDVAVERVESGGVFWVRDGAARVAVAAPPGGPVLEAGQRVRVTGVVEPTGNTTRIRATRISVIE